jgi:hypothetical protein
MERAPRSVQFTAKVFPPYDKRFKSHRLKESIALKWPSHVLNAAPRDHVSSRVRRALTLIFLCGPDRDIP